MKAKDIKTLITSGTIILAVALYLIFSPEQQQVDTPAQYETIEGQKAAIPLDYAEQLIGHKAQNVDYVSINDGDTFTVRLDGEKKKVRLLMVDTPEMNYDKGEPMPYAEEAKQFTEKLLKEAKTIELLFDVGPQTDKYDRLLAYIYIDGVLLQETLVDNGLAVMRYMNKPNISLEKELFDVQARAEKDERNIWSIKGYFDGKRFDDDAVK